MDPQPQELQAILDQAAHLGASHCYIAMRHGKGTVFFIINEVIQPIAPCTPEAFATLHLAACELAGLDHTTQFSAGVFTLTTPKGTLETRLDRFMGLEPALCFTFGINDPLGVLYAEYSLSSPVVLALRQLFTTTPRALYLAGSGEAAEHLSSTLLRAIYFAVESTYGGNVLHVGATPKPAMSQITSQPELNLNVLPAEHIAQTTISLPLSSIGSLPEVIQKQPRMLVVRNEATQVARDSVQLGSLLARDYMPKNWLPLMMLYVNLLPRLCQTCRVGILVEEAPYRELQQKVGAKSITNYAIPATKTASAAYYRYYGTHSILDEIAKDPDMINRSASEAKAAQERKRTIPLFRRGNNPTCSACQGNGTSGQMLIAGFCDVMIDQTNNTSSAQEMLIDRFWTDAFDKLESGLLAYDDFTLIQP